MSRKTPKNFKRRFVRSSYGGMAPFLALGLAGVMMAGAYVVDTSRMTSSAAQVKRATDAAALAVGMQRLADATTPQAVLERIAVEYVQNNLGMDSALRDTLDGDSIEVSLGRTQEGAQTYEVAAAFEASTILLRGAAATVNVRSVAEVFDRPAEIALILPNTLSETAAELSVLRRLSKRFATELLGEGGGNKGQGNIWLSLVPYSQSVNVYDEDDPSRIRRWATSKALRPVELTSLFRTGYRGLDDARIPDRRAKLLCMYRGMRLGDNYYWDEAPNGQFGVYYRHDLPDNGSPGAAPISWVGPNPMLGLANGVNDTRWMVADRGCPQAALLPLTNDMDRIEQRLNEMDTRFNVNYAIAMGWGAVALSPAMRGQAGWGDKELPLDFNEGEGESSNTKAIVMLANTMGNWFDTDSYNFGGPNDPAQKDVGQNGTDGAREAAKRRFVLLCESFRRRNLKFYFIGVRPGDPEDHGRTLFGEDAIPGLQICASDGGLLEFANASSFVDGEDEIQRRLDKIADDIKSKRSYVRLVE